MINGIKVEYPKKLEPHKLMIEELVSMVKQQVKDLVCMHVWTNKRGELFYADFTERPKRLEMKLDLSPESKIKNIETCLKVLENEKTCVERRYGGKCNNKCDCGHCDLALKQDEIVYGYNTAINIVTRVKELIDDFNGDNKNDENN